ncbi:MAG: peptide chain release factor 1 [Pseudomonadota bacterium]
MSLLAKIKPVMARFEEVNALLAEGTAQGDQFVKLTKEYAELRPVVEVAQTYEKALNEFAELPLLKSDPDMADMAEEEEWRLKALLPELEHQIKVALLPKDEDDMRNAILEIRAGTGGEEAALFAGNLFAMYRGYAALKGWRIEVMEMSESDLGGYREIIAEISGNEVFAHLKYESGAHRVQRVPETEAGGRIHTSAATVAVLPEAADVDVTIDEKDLRIDVYRAQGSGGQHVNKTESAVRITHMPSGVVVAIQDEKSQNKNKARAMKILQTRLYDMQRSKLEAERSADRKSQIGSGDRSERIRTYNYPQGRVTDHRINKTTYNLNDVLTGPGLDDFVLALRTEDQAANLAQLGLV